MMVGLCCAVQGLNVIRIGFDIPYFKPDIIKTKDEKIARLERELLEERAEVALLKKVQTLMEEETAKGRRK